MTNRERQLEAALALAANRLSMTAVEAVTGTRQFFERSEWADEARAALSAPWQPPPEDQRPDGYRCLVKVCEEDPLTLVVVEVWVEAEWEAPQWFIYCAETRAFTEYGTPTAFAPLPEL